MGVSLLVTDASSPIRHRLLPPERRFAKLILARRKAQRTPAIVRLEHNYGQEGIALLAASVLVAILGMSVGFIGVGLLLVSGGRDPLVSVAPWIVAIGGLLTGLALMRWAQAKTEGRRFRGSRPFIRKAP